MRIGPVINQVISDRFKGNGNGHNNLIVIVGIIFFLLLQSLTVDGHQTGDKIRDDIEKKMNKLCGRRHHQSCDKKKRAVWGKYLACCGSKTKKRGGGEY